jgi:hypothetical protein
VTLTTGVAGKQTVAVPIIKSTDTLLSGILQFDIFVDTVGNVSSGQWQVSGFNSNGSFIQQADGTMICRGTKATSAYPQTVGLPISFVDITYQVGLTFYDQSGTQATKVANIAAKSVGSFNYYMTTSTTGGQWIAQSCDWVAIGRWI